MLSSAPVIKHTLPPNNKLDPKRKPVSVLITSRAFLIGACAVLAVNVGVAQAKSSEFGAWKFSSFTAPSGKFYCSIISAVANRNVGQNIVIKGSPSTDNLVIDLYKDKWNRRQGTSIKVMFDFVNNQPLAVSAYADAHILDIELPQVHTASFLLELANRPALQVIFQDENEDTWVINGQGAKNAVSQMVSCLQSKR